MQTRILQQLGADNRRKVFMIRNMLRKYDEGDRDIGDSDCGNILAGDLAGALEGLDKGKLRNPAHGGEGGEIKNLQSFLSGRISDQGKDQSTGVTGQNADDKGNQLDHFAALHRTPDYHQKGNKGADEISERAAAHGIAIRHGTAETEGIADGVSGQGQSDNGHGTASTT